MAEVVKCLVRDFNRVVISLENILVPDEKLSTTPSMCDGLNSDAEMDLRILGCELIQTSGNLLKLPQVAMATGQVLYQRFYYSKSFIKHSYEVVAMACVNLASKIEEAPRRIRDVINVVHHLKQIRNKKPVQPLILDQNYVNLKNQVIKAERRVLKELGFCVHVKHPHKIIVMYLQVLEAERNRELVQHSWNYMNDSFRTNVFIRFPPETIACACIYLAARKLQIALPNNPAWYRLFGANEADIQQVCMAILKLYSWHKPNVDELEKTVNHLKKANMEAKLKAKERGTLGATPTLASQAATPEKNCAPSPAIRSDVLRRLKSDDEKSSDSFGRDLPRGRKRRGSRSHSGDVRHKKTRPDHNIDKHSRSSSSRSPRPISNSKSDLRRNDTLGAPDVKYLGRHKDNVRSRTVNARADVERRDDRRDRREEKRATRDDKDRREDRIPTRYAIEVKKHSSLSSKRSPSTDDRLRKKLSRQMNHSLSPGKGRSNSISPDLDLKPNKLSSSKLVSSHKNGHRSKERRIR